MSNSSSSNPLVQEQYARYHEDLGPSQLAACGLCIAFVALAVSIRFFAQALPPSTSLPQGAWATQGYSWKKATRRWDTWFINLAAMFAVGTTACNIASYHHGLGKHQVRVLAEDPNPPQDTAIIFMYGYIIKILQAPCLMFTKLAIIVYYKRIFGRANKAFRFALYAVAAWSVALGVGSTIEFIVACLPIEFFWNRLYVILGGNPPDGGPTTGYCMPTVISTVIPLFGDLLSEIALLVLPAIALWNVKLSLTKKVGLYLIFTLGGFVTCISIVRLYYAWILEDSGDLTWDDANVFIWTSVQACIAVVCACIPASAPLYRLFLSRYGSTSPGQSGYSRGWRSLITRKSQHSKASEELPPHSSEVELTPTYHV